MIRSDLGRMGQWSGTRRSAVGGGSPGSVVEDNRPSSLVRAMRVDETFD